jgi:hypothetical protein
MPDPVNRHAARAALLDPSSRLSELLGIGRPRLGREPWMCEAARLVARDVPLDHASSMVPLMDDLGPEL